jgi:uncharacterized protein
MSSPLITLEQPCDCKKRMREQSPTVPFAPVGLLIVQATPFCNINCSYCYLGDRLNKARMSLSTVEAIARFVRDLPLAKHPLPLVWHAGEPLVMPMSFYEQAVEHFTSAAPELPLQHQFQTNATLLTDEWCQLIKRTSIRVGVSIDGPKHIHDANRVDRAGKGTFERTIRGIGKLREHHIPFTVISVITRAALDRPDEVWEFLASLGASQLAFNIEEVEGAHHSSSLEGRGLRDLVRDFFARIAELQTKMPEVRVRELDDMRRHLTAPVGSSVNRANNSPGSIINIDVAGNVTTLSPELLGQVHPRYGQFNWGNVHTDSWDDVLHNPEFLRVLESVEAGVEKCKASCGYFAVCGGGNPSNKLAELDTLDGAETLHCSLHVQTVADVVIDRMEREQRKHDISTAGVPRSVPIGRSAVQQAMIEVGSI